MMTDMLVTVNHLPPFPKLSYGVLGYDLGCVLVSDHLTVFSGNFEELPTEMEQTVSGSLFCVGEVKKT